MGWLRAIADKFDPETRSTDFAELFGGVDLAGGKIVSSRTAENLSTVIACVNAISSSIVHRSGAVGCL